MNETYPRTLVATPPTPVDPYPGAQSVSRALALLKCFSDQRPEWTLADLSRAVNLNKTTAYRLLAALEAEGMLARSVNIGANLHAILHATIVSQTAVNEVALSSFRGQGFGHELEHVYLSRNLEKYPVAVKRRAKRATPEASRPRRQGARTVLTLAEIVTPSIQDPTLLDRPSDASIVS